jgi:hypothetical protein
MVLNYYIGKDVKEAVVTYFKVLSQHLSGRTEEIHERSHSG